MKSGRGKTGRTSKTNACIIGDGAMGTLCAMILAQGGHAVRLWGRRPEHIAEIAAAHENKLYLPGVRLPDQIIFTSDDATAFDDCALILCAVPAQYIRGVLERLKNHIPFRVPVLSVAKGIENHSLLRPTQIIQEVIGERPVAALSGPSIAAELARGLPATLVVAARDEHLTGRVQRLFTTNHLRIYRNADLPGVELAGAVKNVIAIAAGILDGLRTGTNAKAALLTRGLVEITRLGVAMDARTETFSGLAGLGDLVTTCFAPAGRNRTFGEYIGRGLQPTDAAARVRGVVEGIATTQSVVELARRRHVEMPISQCLHAVLFANKNPRQGISDLMGRQPKYEHVRAAPPAATARKTGAS
jgi:glycerol-3-phosphate dehydrogenase (NAD(P)+)